MDRKLAILLSLCLGVVCAFVFYVGRASTAESDEASREPTVVTCKQLLTEWPRDNYHLLLTDFQRGKNYVAYDHDQDDNWELVYVPLFPSNVRKLGNNYRSVIVHFDDVRNEVELDQKLASGELDSQLWYTQQKLSVSVHSDLAQQYRLMDFSKSVVLQGGFRPPSVAIAAYAVIGSYLGMIASGIIVVWNGIAMLLPKRRPHDFFDDDKPITNRAGLPDF